MKVVPLISPRARELAATSHSIADLTHQEGRHAVNLSAYLQEGEFFALHSIQAFACAMCSSLTSLPIHGEMHASTFLKYLAFLPSSGLPLAHCLASTYVRASGSHVLYYISRYVHCTPRVSRLVRICVFPFSLLVYVITTSCFIYMLAIPDLQAPGDCVGCHSEANCTFDASIRLRRRSTRRAQKRFRK
jgi:hypothetical protein